ncbi:MAG TPA: SpoIVB peptidase S55 domain-containing protein, partial [Pilimelia sp.]|nr:SpoIVB peptidase S55 domain-containing protein [Pilimelia sp.]
LLTGSLAATAAAAAPSRGLDTGWPTPVPIDEITAGMTGTGLTVSRGTTADPFTVTILGVLPNGIGPGVDMIVFEGDSPALDAAGGIWAGMSGSPVYTGDGRLIGAVAYGFTLAPSKIGGITPATAMMELLTHPATVAGAKAKRVALPASMRSAMVAKGKATAAQVAAGLAPLPIPLAVSGLTANRIARLNAEFERSGSPLRAYSGAAAPGTPAPGGAIFAGSNFGAAISYGDLTLAAVGTTTAVSNGRALAFGHPMLFTGPSTMSAHHVSAIAVVKDETLGAFKLATVGGVAGAVDQDRLVGLRARLGAGPQGPVPVTSTVRSGTTERSSTSWGTVSDFLPLVVGQQLISNLDRVFDRIGAGRATLSWTIQGTRTGGAAWQLARSNQYASTSDVTFESFGEVPSQLATVLQNEFTAVKITNVAVSATVEPEFRQYTVDGVQVKRNGAWVDLRDGQPVAVRPGKPLDLRVRLAAYRAPARLVNVRLAVPAGTFDAGTLQVTGMTGASVELPAPKTFAELLKSLRTAPKNNHLTVALALTSGDTERVVRNVVAMDEIVTGERQHPAQPA